MDDRPAPHEPTSDEISIEALQQFLDRTAFASIDDLIARHGGPALASASRGAAPVAHPSTPRRPSRLTDAPPLPRRR